MEESLSEGLNIALFRSHLREAISSRGLCLLRDRESRVDQIAQCADQDDAQGGGDATLPHHGVAVAHIALIWRQHRDHEEKEHHNSASVDQDLHDRDKHSVELEIEHSQEDQSENHAQRAIHGILEGDDPYSRGRAGNCQHEKGDSCSNIHYFSFLLSSSCSSSVKSTGRSVWVVPRPTAAALACEPSKT